MNRMAKRTFIYSEGAIITNTWRRVTHLYAINTSVFK